MEFEPPQNDEIDFAGLMDHKAKVAVVTGTLKERAAFILSEHVSVLAKEDAKKAAEIQSEVEDTELVVRLSKASVLTAGMASSSSTDEGSMDIDGGTGATGAAAAEGTPADGHVRERWVYDSAKGAYFPPVGPLNGTPKWSCGKCGKHRPKFQHMFFIEVATGDRLGGRQNCAACLKRDFNSGKVGEWKLPKAPWEQI